MVGSVFLSIGRTPFRVYACMYIYIYMLSISARPRGDDQPNEAEHADTQGGTIVPYQGGADFLADLVRALHGDIEQGAGAGEAAGDSKLANIELIIGAEAFATIGDELGDDIKDEPDDADVSEAEEAGGVADAIEDTPAKKRRTTYNAATGKFEKMEEKPNIIEHPPVHEKTQVFACEGLYKFMYRSTYDTRTSVFWTGVSDW